MSLDVLTRCSGLSQKQVEGAIAPAIDGGFVKKLFSQRLGTLTLVPHDILRGHFVALDESEEDLRADKCYLQNTQNINGTSSSGDIITRIDRLFAQIRIAFTEYWREHKDSERLSNKLELALADLSDLSCEERLSSAQAMDITRLFEQALVLPVAHACPAVIAVAHSVRSMARSPRFGDMIWSGASCYDGWARAASIVAAVGHWKGDSSGRQENIERCQLWYRSFGIQNRDYFKGEWDKLHPTGFDWDLAALAVAFFVLGAPDEGMEIFHDASTRWIEPGAEAQMLHASAIVALTDAGDQERLAELFRLALKRPTTAHLDTALAYAAKHHNRLAILSKTSPRYGKFNLSVGFAAQSDRFKKYAKELAPKQFTYL